MAENTPINPRSRIRTAWLDLDPSIRLQAKAPAAAIGNGHKNGELLPELFRSPLFTLITNVYRFHPDTARHHLRKPIGVDGQLDFAEKMLVKIGAKRTRLSSDPLETSGFPGTSDLQDTSAPRRSVAPGEAEDSHEAEASHDKVEDPREGADPHKAATQSFRAPAQSPTPEVKLVQPLPLSFQIPPLPTALIRTGADLRHVLEEILIPPTDERPRYLQNRPVSAILIDRDGQIRFAARNEGATVRCLHAEMNLLRQISHQHREWPPDTLIAVSLKPCRMCAAYLVSAASTLRNVRVIALENDSGALASGTALETASPGRLEFLRMRDRLPPTDAQAVVRSSEYRSSLQLLASDTPDFDSLTLDELWKRTSSS